MAIIVNKEKKRKDIAFSCKEIIIEKGIHDLTISQIAQTARIGKGTFYEYFKSKEELLFELVNLLMHAYNVKKEIKLAEVESTKDKIKIFADFFYEEESKDLRVLYKMFIGISLLSPQKDMVDFQTECFNYYYHWFERIIHEGIEKKEIPPQSIDMAKGLFSMAKGLFIASKTTHSVQDVKAELDLFIDTLFEIIQIKEKK